MIETRHIIERLVQARKAAGLTQTQAAKLIGLATASSLSEYELSNAATEPTLTRFLKMCEVYGVSPVWALTGVNPDFDERRIDQMIVGTNVIAEDAIKLRELLTMISTSPDTDESENTDAT